MSETPTIVSCPVCHFENERGASFCGGCGEYLDPDTVEAAPPPSPSPSIEVSSPPPDAAESEETPPDDATDTDGAATASSPGTAPPVIGTRPDAVALRKPSAPVSQGSDRASVRPPAPEPPRRADDIVCPRRECRALNRPDRRFCRRCATPLRPEAVTVASAQPVAGSRPKGRTVRFPFTATVVLLVLLGGLTVGWLFRDAVIGFVRGILQVLFSTSG